MIRFVFIAVKIEGRSGFFAVFFLIIDMVGAMDIHLPQLHYHVGMIPPPAFAIPDGIAIVISGDDDILKIGFIHLEIFPELADVTVGR